MELVETTSIYEIINKETGESYIGAANQVFGRWRLHCSKLEKGKHHNHKLQKLFNDYGISAFSFNILEYEIPADDSNEREQHWINLRGSLNINLKSSRRLRIEKYWRVAYDLRHGLTYREISEKHNISLGSITSISRKFNLKR